MMRVALIGDAQSPHLLKWARAYAQDGVVSLRVASSRGFLPEFDAFLPAAHRLALDTRPDPAGGNAAILRSLPRLGRWLREVDADWLNPHYLTSHGTLAWLARTAFGLRARIVGSAWGSDILLAPQRSVLHRALTARVLRACALCTSDSHHMTERMRELGAAEVMTFPFGLDAMPPAPPAKEPWLFFANRGLEPLYRPDAVLDLFARVRAVQPTARLVVANDGSLRDALARQSAVRGLADAVTFTGRLDAARQADWYERARWYVSLPASDSVAVSVLEAMAHGCVPVLSDLPANRELVRDGENGMIVSNADLDPMPRMAVLLPRADAIATVNREWVARNALFAPAVARLLSRMKELSSA